MTIRQECKGLQNPVYFTVRSKCDDCTCQRKSLGGGATGRAGLSSAHD